MSGGVINDPTNSQVEWYRKWSLENGKDTSGYTNEEITNFLGSHYEKQGLSQGEISSNFGADFSNSYLDYKNRADPNQGYLDEFTSGLKSASYGLASTGVGALGLGAGAIGLDGVEESLMSKAADLSEKAAQDKPTIERASDVRWSNPGEVARFLAGGMGEATPSVVESAGAYLAGGGVGYGIAKNRAKKAIKKLIGERTKDVSAAEQVENMFKEGIKADARRGFATGSMAATAVSSIGLGQGEIYTSLYENTKLDPNDKDYIDPSRARSIATAFGAVSGGLDFVGAATLLSKLTGAPQKVAKDYYKRLLLGLPEGVFVEGGTEALQEFINIAAEKYGKGQELEFDGQEISRLFDAGVLGAVGGGQFTAIGAVRGPKDSTQDEIDTSAPVSEDPTTFKQQNLLEDIQEKRGKDARFQPGDSVQVALGGKGEVERVVGDTAIIKMEDGTLKTNVPMSTLSSPIDKTQDSGPALPKAGESTDGVFEKAKEDDVLFTANGDAFQVRVDPKGVKYLEGNNSFITPDVISKIQLFTEKPSNTKESVSAREVGSKKSNGPLTDVNINGNNVSNVSESAAKDAVTLFDKLKALAKIDGVDGMSKDNARANKTGGFASNSKSDVKLALGEDAKLYRPEVLAVLRKAGVINNSNAWLLGTKLDDDFDLKESERVKAERVKRSNADFLEVGRNVGIKRSGGKSGVVSEHTSEGMVVVDGVEYEPGQLSPKAAKAQKEKVSKELAEVWNQGQSEDLWGNSTVSKDIEEVLNEPEFLFTQENDKDTGQTSFVAKNNFEFNKDTKVKLLWTTGLNKRRTDSKDKISASSVDELSNSVRDFVKSKIKSKSEKETPFAKSFYGVEIDGKVYYASIEGQVINIAGLEIDNSDKQELDAQKGDIPFAISTIEVDESGSDLTQGVDERSKPTGAFKENTGRNSSTTKVTLVLRQYNADEKYPKDSIRVVSVYTAKFEGKDAIKGYNSETGKYIRIKGEPGKTVVSDSFHTYEIVGKITATDAGIGNVDLYFESFDAFLLNPKVAQAIENGGKEISNKDNKAAKAAKEAQEAIEKLESELEALDERIEEEGKPSDEDLQQASDEVTVNSDDGFIEGSWEQSGEETRETSRAKDYLHFVDFSSGKTVSETIEALTNPSGESESMTLTSMLKAFGLEWTGGSTVKSNGRSSTSGSYAGSENPTAIASAMNNIFGRIIRGDVSTIRKGTAEIRPEHVQSFASVYMEHFDNGDKKPPTTEYARKAHKFLKAVSEMESPEKQIQAEAQKLADKRVQKLKETRRALVKNIADKKETREKYVDAGSITEENGKKLLEFQRKLDEGVTIYQDWVDGGRQTVSPPKGAINPDEAVEAYQRKYYELNSIEAQKQSGENNNIGGDIIVQLGGGVGSASFSSGGLTSGTVEAEADSKDAGLSDEDSGSNREDSTNTPTQTDELGNTIGGKQEISAEDIALLEASAKKYRFQDLDLEQLINLVFREGFKDDFMKLLASHIENKINGLSLESGNLTASHENALDNLIEGIYDFFVEQPSSPLKPEVTGANGSQQVLEFSKLSSDKKIPMRESMNALLKYADEKGLDEKAKSSRARSRHKSNAMDALKAGAEPFQVFENVLGMLGHYPGSDVSKKFYDIVNLFSAVPVYDAHELDVNELLNRLNPEGIFDNDSLLKALEEVYGVDVNYEINSSPEGLLLRDHIRNMVNPNYVVTSDPTDVFTHFQANRFDAIEEGSSGQRIDNLVDPTTGEVTTDQVVVVSEATNEESIKNAKLSKQSYMAPVENPLSSNPELVEQGRAAMEAFAPFGMDVSFSLTTALNQLKNTKQGEIANVARLLNNSILQGFTIEFMSWDKFRKYASPAKGILNKAVILHEDKRIIISDAFNNSYKHSAESMLAADILHEAVHAVTRPALDLGYAYSSGKQDLINDMVEQHGLPEKYNMNAEALGKVWNDINDTLLPYLREKSKSSLKRLYGLSSIDEFFSELSSDPEFQNFLANTDLPKSMRPAKSKLRTVLDYILNLLAKLGFNTAQTPDALTYARGELNKLIEISNSSTELTEQIAAANLRNISTLAATFKKTDINLDYYDLLERISQETARDGTGGTLEDAASHLRGSTPARERDTGSKILTSARKEEQDAEVLKYAKENGLLLSDKEFQDKHRAYRKSKSDDILAPFGGAESDIYVDEESQRVFKRNTLAVHDGDTVAYLNRLIIHNLLFPTTAYKLEGFVSRDTASPDLTEVYQRVNVVVSQPFINGVPVTQAEIANHIAGLGILKAGSPSIRGAIGNDINLSDLRADNAIKDADGNIHIIDPIIEQESSLVRVLEARLEKLDDENGDPDDILDAIYDLYGIPGYVPSAEIEALKRSAEDELGITGEESGMNALMNAIMGGRDTTVQGNQFEPLTVSDFIPVVTEYDFSPTAGVHDKSFLDISTIDESILKKLRESWGNPSMYLSDVTAPINAFHDKITKVLKRDLDFYNQFKSRGTEDGDIKAQKMLNNIIERIGDIEMSKGLGPAAQEALSSLNHQGVIDGIIDQLQKIKEGSTTQTVQGNQFQNPTSNDSPRPANARPDDNALVMAEANAAGFNELIKELVKVHRIYGEKLGMELDEFLETYGRPGSTKISDIKQILDKELSQHNKTSEGITLDNAGLNKIARSWGVRKAIMNLEKVREKARKEGSRSTLLVEQTQQDIIDSRNMYSDLLQGKFPSRDKLGDRVNIRLDSTKFEVLQEYVKAFPNSGISQADLKAVRSITTEQILGIMDAVVEAVDLRGNPEIDFLSKEEFNKELERSDDPRLAVIQGDSLKQRTKRFAVLRAIRESKDAMSIMRLSKGKIGTTEEKFKEAASAIGRAKSKAEIDRVDIKFPGTLSTPLKHFASMKERELEAIAKLDQEKARQEINAKINSMLENRSTRLRMALGELQPVNIHDGVTLITMKQVNGKWERANYKVEIKNGKFMDRDGFAKANKDTLVFVRDPDMIKKHGHEPWFEIMREQALMALTEPIMEEQFHIQRAAWYAGLQGLTERFAKLGYEGKKLSQMSTATVALYRDYASQSQAYAKQFNASLHRVMAKLKIGGNEVYTGLYQDIFWWFDNHPEYAGKEEEGFKALWKHLKANANIPNRALLDDDARRLVIDMVNKALVARDWEAEVNKRMGNRIRDEDVKVESFVNQEMVDFYRMPMDMGYATMPRTLNDGYIRDTYSLMKKSNWHAPEVDGLLSEARQLRTSEGMEDIYKALFNTQIVERFVKPYTNTDVRQSVFKGPKDSEGDMLPMGNSFISTAFEKTGGDVYAMSNYIFDKLSENKSDSARAQWQYAFLNQFFKRFKELEGVAKRVSTQKDGMSSGDSMRNTPQSLDARGVENRLPKEFFSYNMYDEVSSNIRLALMAATSQFGRNGDSANAAYRDGKQTLGEAAETFNVIMAEATKSDHPKPQTHYSRSVKRKAYAILRGRPDILGDSTPEKVWNDLYSKSIARGEMDIAFDHLGKYYGKSNVAGPYQDANLLMDILGVQSISVLNNPKSSFFQALSLFEYPNAFRGLNKIAGKATVSALGNFVDQTFGGMLEAMGVELGKTSRYAQYLNETHFNMKEMELPFSEYNSMIGSGGDLAESIRNHPQLGMKKYIRFIKNLSTHHKQNKKDGTRAPIDPLSLITGIFPYVNNVVNHSVGVGAIHTYSDLVLQVSKVIQERGLTEYTELSAKDLGMGNKLGEWIIGEEDGYIRANEMLVNSGAPSVSRLAFDYLDRKKADKQALPIDKRMGLLINQAAMNNVSGEGFNSKPSALYTNDFLKYFSTFLGWPLGKMSRDLDQILRDPSDRIGTMRALMKYVGMMSAVYVPTGLSFAMLIDWYDEEILEKPNNLPPISPWAALPVIGPFIAADDPNFTVYSITSRMAKAGVPFGMGMDLANGIFAKGDPFGAAREISLDSRIFAWSMFKNIYDALGTWAIAGEFDWQMVGRPIAYGVGGNSVIQMMDLTTALLDIDSEERRVANYIGMRNHIKKTAFLMGLPLRPPRKGGGVQTGVSINTRQMARAAFAGDSDSFLENYQEALDAAKIYLDERGRDDDPEKYVSDAFKDRTIQGNITQGTMKDADWENLLGILDPDVRAQIEQAVASHEHYLKLIGGTPRVSKESKTQKKLEEARIAYANYYLQ